MISIAIFGRMGLVEPQLLEVLELARRPEMTRTGRAERAGEGERIQLRERARFDEKQHDFIEVYRVVHGKLAVIDDVEAAQLPKGR